MKVSLSSPWVTQEDKEAVMAVLNSQHLALGPVLGEFESKCAELAGVNYAVALSSGTSALTLNAMALGWKEGDEIITPSFSFVASANTIMHVGAKPVFVDIDPKTWNLSVPETEQLISKKTKGVQAVDVFGLPFDGISLESLCQKNGLDLVEDACEAVGAVHADGRPCGALGRSGTWAFYPNKQVTSAEGGMLLTNEKEIADHVRSLSNQGRGTGGWFDSVRLGYNARMSELHAALGLSQINRLDEICKRRSEVAHWYEEELKDIKELSLMSGQGRSWFVYVIKLGETGIQQKFIQWMSAQGIQCSNYFVPIHLMSHMKERWGTKEGQCPKTEELARKTVALPFSSVLTRENVAYVSAKVREFFGST